jgi:hypothetical protein
MNNAVRIRRLLARDRKLDYVPEALIARTSRLANLNASDAELLASVAEGCSEQGRQYRRAGWPYRAGALEKLAMRLREAASKEALRDI